MSSGLFVTGHVRSGTSMTAGLFAQHGVFFGRCRGPSTINAKGFWENDWLKRTMHNDSYLTRWPEAWFDELRKEGWDEERPWGAKLMPKWWARMRLATPDVVVCCRRPEEDILASCERVRWRRSRETVYERNYMMDEIEAPLVVNVHTPLLAYRDYTEIRPAFEALGIEFDEGIARRWIDPKLFHGSGT